MLNSFCFELRLFLMQYYPARDARTTTNEQVGDLLSRCQVELFRREEAV
jgi:hypothetical protein